MSGLSSFMSSSTGGTLLGALVGGAFNMGSQALGQKYARQEYDHQMASQYDYQKLYNQLARDETEYYWQKYQSPAAQMQAFSDAGLNPNLIYGQNASVSPMSYKGSNASEQPAGNLLSGMSGIVQQAISDYIALQNNERQNKQIENQSAETIARINNLESQIENRNVQTELLELRKIQQELINQLMSEENPLKIEFLKRRISLTDEQIKNLQVRTEYVPKDFDLNKLRYNLQKKLIDFQTDPVKNLNPIVRIILGLFGMDDENSIKDKWDEYVKEADSPERKKKREKIAEYRARSVLGGLTR